MKLWRDFSRVKFPPLDGDDVNYEEFRTVAKQACLSIWSTKVFNEIDNNAESGNSKGQESIKSLFNRVSGLANGCGGVLSTMLKNFKEGRVDDGSEYEINPSHFEGFVKLCIENGKMSVPQKIYYLIMGATVKNASGQTLMSKGSLQKFFALYKNIPEMAFFNDCNFKKYQGMSYPDESAPPQAFVRSWSFADYEIWREKIDENDGTFEAGSKLDKFYWKYVQPNPEVRIPSRTSRH